MLLAVGITAGGKRRVLGVSVALSEAEAHWRVFLQSLQARGLTGVQLIVADDHAGLKKARAAVFPSVPWQRCQFHLQQNAQAYVPRLEMRGEVGQALRAVFTAPNRTEAERMLKLAITTYEKIAPKLAAWMEANVPEGLTVFELPIEHRTRCRTVKGLERLNKELARRTRVATLFPNEDSLLRLVTAVVGEIDEDWATGKIYLTIKPINQTRIPKDSRSKFQKRSCFASVLVSADMQLWNTSPRAPVSFTQAFNLSMSANRWPPASK